MNCNLSEDQCARVGHPARVRESLGNSPGSHSMSIRMSATRSIRVLRHGLTTASLLCFAAIAAAAPTEGNSSTPIAPAPLEAPAAPVAPVAPADLQAPPQVPDVANAVVKVFSTMRYP